MQNELVSLITCTGGRPEAFKLCAQYVARQTYKGPVEWIVVDDLSSQPTTIPQLPANIKLQKINAKTQWRTGYNTQRSNMNEALALAKGNIIAVLEDDDVYSPNYLEANIAFLGSAKLVGEIHNRYYNVKVPGYQVMTNVIHSSLASTLFRRELLPQMDAAVNSGDFYFDVVFWRIATELEIPHVFHRNTGLYVGMKGLPGKPGLTGSHRDTKGFMFDSELQKLKHWVGEADARNYLQFIKQGEVKPITAQSSIRTNYNRATQQVKVEHKIVAPLRNTSSQKSLSSK